jgi:hypothetical protein
MLLSSQKAALLQRKERQPEAPQPRAARVVRVAVAGSTLAALLDSSATAARRRRSAKQSAARLCRASRAESPSAAPDDAEDDSPWLREVESELSEKHKWDGVLAVAAAAHRRRGGWVLLLRGALAGVYLLALSLLLSFVPALPHVLQTTPAQLQLFALALLVGERAGACQGALEGGVRALLRADQESGIYAQLAADGRAGAADAAREATLSEARTRQLLLRHAVAAPLELAGAVLAALAPFPAPGVALMCASQLPLRSFGWHADEHGVLQAVALSTGPRLLRADAALVALAATQAAFASFAAPPALLGGLAAAQLAVVLHIISVGWDARAPPTPLPALSAV